MSRNLRTAEDVVAALGGNRSVQTLTGSKHDSAICNWKRLGKFPAKTHKIMKDALRQRALDAPDDLWGIIHG